MQTSVSGVFITTTTKFIKHASAPRHSLTGSVQWKRVITLKIKIFYQLTPVTPSENTNVCNTNGCEKAFDTCTQAT